MPSLHVRHAGVSREIPFEDLLTPENLVAVGINEGLASTPMSISSSSIKQIAANYLDVALSDFDAYEVDFHKNENITLRPEAEFGQC